MSAPQAPLDDHWLTRPRTIRILWVLFAMILAGTVLLQLTVKVKGNFDVDGSFAFAAWFGFGCCVLMVLAARTLGWLLKRSEDYYEAAVGEAAPGSTLWTGTPGPADASEDTERRGNG